MIGEFDFTFAFGCDTLSYKYKPKDNVNILHFLWQIKNPRTKGRGLVKSRKWGLVRHSVVFDRRRTTRCPFRETAPSASTLASCPATGNCRRASQGCENLIQDASISEWKSIISFHCFLMTSSLLLPIGVTVTTQNCVLFCTIISGRNVYLTISLLLACRIWNVSDSFGILADLRPFEVPQYRVQGAHQEGCQGEWG